MRLIHVLQNRIFLSKSRYSRSITSLSQTERLAITIGASAVALADPSRSDMVALLGEITGESALRRLLSRLQKQTSKELTKHLTPFEASIEDGAQILKDRPRISLSHEEVERLGVFPCGTFGRAYFEYLTAHGFSPAERGECRLVLDNDLRFVLQRYREVHDFFHVLSGLPPTVLGETGVKWLELAHMKLPVAALSAVIAPVRLTHSERALLFTRLAPWAMRCGSQCKFLLGVRYETLFQEDLNEVRKALHFEIAPSI
jgi:ubiquinone biosynthesis protein COQ4